MDLLQMHPQRNKAFQKIYLVKAVIFLTGEENISERMKGGGWATNKKINK